MEALLNPAQRSGIRLAEVFNPELFESKLRRLAAGYRKRFGDLFEYDVEEELARFNQYRPKLAKYVVDGVSFIRSAQESNMNIVVEGANVSVPFRRVNVLTLTDWWASKRARGLILPFPWLEKGSQAGGAARSSHSCEKH